MRLHDDAGRNSSAPNLEQRIDSLEQELKALKSDSGKGNASDSKPKEPGAFGEKKKKGFEGFKLESEDKEYSLQMHLETQLDLRVYGQGNQDPLNEVGLYMPRARMAFNGTLTKPIEYNLMFNRSVSSFDLFDAFVNFNYDPRFQFRIGRFRMPFTYEWYSIANQFLIAPERSVFAVNYGYNRNTAAMIHGTVLDEQLDYALSVAAGPRNSYADENNSKDIIGYVNWRPLAGCGSSTWERLNIGGSFGTGVQEQTALPINFHTSFNFSEASVVPKMVPSFLRLNGNVTENGLRQLGEIHLAHYVGSMTLLSAIDAGFNTYGFNNKGGHVRLPTSGYHVQVGYFVTGEEVTQRGLIAPLRPFDLRSGKMGPGAIELQTRFSHFDVGEEVFSGGLSDKSLWTNRVNAVDSGLNWYLNNYVKVYFDWQRSFYGNRVTTGSGRSADHSDLFWLRTQIYF
ncbi:MAG: porin [Pirellulales bacterium]